MRKLKKYVTGNAPGAHPLPKLSRRLMPLAFWFILRMQVSLRCLKRTSKYFTIKHNGYVILKDVYDAVGASRHYPRDENY
jgi:hypothetical protein